MKQTRLLTCLILKKRTFFFHFFKDHHFYELFKDFRADQQCIRLDFFLWIPNWQKNQEKQADMKLLLQLRTIALKKLLREGSHYEPSRYRELTHRFESAQLVKFKTIVTIMCHNYELSWAMSLLQRHNWIFDITGASIKGGGGNCPHLHFGKIVGAARQRRLAALLLALLLKITWL